MPDRRSAAERIAAELADARATDPCDRTDPHIAHRNHRSERVGICPGRTAPATEETPSA